ncbi:hypothetical protein [Streptomyces clavuligerus]|uniref:hypothetical protein n=1 Tax=Streptomyces clavuligerus TaxID=1901 RepID=UPI00018008BC|nr:hypothetical protein [Streptomyces clavuligerus]EDY52988.1 hypothetical protein SSCG_06070 [Streptomyces clavuligerus]WDN55997.1 hypothetical protein LL058_29365 [Streptomyces clavuligerus]
MTDRYPHRVRLHGGRSTHAARDLLGGDRETACGYYLDDGAVHHWMPPTAAAITCTACCRKIAKESP